jgi:hypothetical protein
MHRGMGRVGLAPRRRLAPKVHAHGRDHSQSGLERGRRRITAPRGTPAQALTQQSGCSHARTHALDTMLESPVPVFPPTPLCPLLTWHPQKRVCPRGKDCPFAHSMTEYFLHPSRYRTQLCNDGSR